MGPTQKLTLPRTPHSKLRLNYNTPKSSHPSPNPNPVAKEAEHPVEVIGRIRDYYDKKVKPLAHVLQINDASQTLRVRTDIGYRDFVLDGVSMSEREDLDAFYRKFVEGRIRGVKIGNKCTIMMYGPTGSGKSYTMFGSVHEQGIVYKSLKEILCEDEVFVEVSVLEVYNEEIYDLLSSNGGASGLGYGFPKGSSASKVKLEVMGKKAKNATVLSGTDAGKISKEIQKVEKRRIVKTTNCNERSSRSHCMIILNVPTTGGRLMLVDMAGSENIDQAGQNSFEAKMQTARINQGNMALKRVVESIANGDSHVPFRDSKLTMLLQDSFEDNKSKILMILCASPDPKEMYKTISTLEYGSKAKCIVRGRGARKGEDEDSSVISDSRLVAMDQFISRLQMENKIKEKERNEARNELTKKEEEISGLRLKLETLSEKGGVSEEEINMKVIERTRILQTELEKKLEECRRMTDEFVEMERRRMKETIRQQQEEVEILRRKLQEYESEMLIGKMFLSSNPSEDTEPVIDEASHRVCLSTVFDDEGESDEMELEAVEEIKKEVVDERRVSSFTYSPEKESNSGRLKRIQNIFTLCGNHRELSRHETPFKTMPETDTNLPSPAEISSEKTPKPMSKVFDLKENCDPNNDQTEVYVKWEASREGHGKFIATVRAGKDTTLAELRKLIEISLGADNKPFTFLALGDPSGAPVAKHKEVAMKASDLPVCNGRLRGHLACLRSEKDSGTNGGADYRLRSIENKLPLTPIPLTLHRSSNLLPKLPHSCLKNLSSSPTVA